MADFITLARPSCGSELQITDDIDRFNCASCRNERLVKRSGGIVSLAPVVAGIEKVQEGVDKTTSELAIHRLSAEVEALEARKREVQARISRRWTNAGFRVGLGAGVLLSLCGISFLGQLSAYENAACYAMIVAIVLVLGLGALGAAFGARQAREETAAECGPIDREIETKQQEIWKHKGVVGS